MVLFMTLIFLLIMKSMNLWFGLSMFLFQFWSVYVLCSAQNKDAVRLTLEQIDVVKRMCQIYPELELVTTSQGDTFL